MPIRVKGVLHICGIPFKHATVVQEGLFEISIDLRAAELCTKIKHPCRRRAAKKNDTIVQEAFCNQEFRKKNDHTECLKAASRGK